MNAYVYKADIYCEECAQDIMRECSGIDHYCENKEDPENYPQGPYPSGGGEADTPQHCGECGLFLENPLTPDGREYAQQAVENDLFRCNPSPTVALWRRYYVYNR